MHAENIIQSRNVGLDLCKIVAMFAVVILHICGHGGILEASCELTASYVTVWLVEIVALPAVNTFVIISGFLGYKHEKYFPQYDRVLNTFFQVVFYCCIITFLFFITKYGDVSVKEIIKGLFPIITGQYWFYSAYVILVILSPCINKLVYSLDKNGDKLIFVLIWLISLYTTIASVYSDPFTFKGGYSVCWFIVLYTTGALFKKNDWHLYFKTKKVVYIVLILYTCTISLKIMCSGILGNITGNIFIRCCDKVIMYTSPTMLGCGLCIMIIFSKLHFGEISKKVIRKMVSASFGVYLIHDNPFIRMYLINNAFTNIVSDNPLEIITKIF